MFERVLIKIEQSSSNTVKGTRFIGTIYDDEQRIVFMHSTPDLDALMQSMAEYLKAEIFINV
jgi:hypothetical protein